MGSLMNACASWRNTVAAGVCLILIGIGAGYLDVATQFRFDFISRYFDVFSFAALAGVLLAFVGCIGWSRHLKKRQKILLAVAAFIFPWMVLLVGYPIGGINMHGAAAPAMVIGRDSFGDSIDHGRLLEDAATRQAQNLII